MEVFYMDENKIEQYVANGKLHTVLEDTKYVINYNKNSDEGIKELKNDWSLKKRKSLRLKFVYLNLSNYYKKQGDLVKADYYMKCHNAVMNCAEYLTFNECYCGEHKRLKYTSFCKNRLCPLCNWRRSLIDSKELLKTVETYKSDNPDCKAVFVTMSIKNCNSSEVGTHLDMYLSAFNLMHQRASWKRAFVGGWYRKIEINRNRNKRSKNYNTYNIHIHCEAFVPDESYFSRSNKNYLSYRKGKKLWQESINTILERNGLPQQSKVYFDIRTVKAQGKYKELEAKSKVNNAEFGAIKEITKYVTKDTDYLDIEDKEMQMEVVETLALALKGRRLTAYGGELKRIHNKLFKRKKKDEENLVNIDETKVTEEAEICEVCNTPIREVTYCYDYQLKNYYTARAMKSDETEEEVAQEHEEVREMRFVYFQQKIVWGIDGVPEIINKAVM